MIEWYSTLSMPSPDSVARLEAVLGRVRARRKELEGL